MRPSATSCRLVSFGLTRQFFWLAQVHYVLRTVSICTSHSCRTLGGRNVCSFFILTIMYMYIGRVIPKHVKDPRVPVDKSRVLISDITDQIPE